VAFVTLQPIVDDELLELVAEVAATDAAPHEVMPGAEGVDQWTDELRAGFLAFHRGRFGGLDGPAAEQGYAVLAQDEVVGVARLQRHPDGAHEVGIWIAASRRGEGLGTAALAALRTRAAQLGVRELVADTTATNVAALTMLRRHGVRLTPGGGGTLRGRFE